MHHETTVRNFPCMDVTDVCPEHQKEEHPHFYGQHRPCAASRRQWSPISNLFRTEMLHEQDLQNFQWSVPSGSDEVSADGDGKYIAILRPKITLSLPSPPPTKEMPVMIGRLPQQWKKFLTQQSVIHLMTVNKPQIMACPV